MYTGVNVGLDFFSTKDFTFPSGRIEKGWTNTEVLAGGQIGIRYFITKRLGVQTELNLNNNKTILVLD